MASPNSFGVPKGVKRLPNGRTKKMNQTHCPICHCELHNHEFVVVKGKYHQERCKHCNVEKEQTWLIGDVEVNGATYDIRNKCPCLNDHVLVHTPVDPYDLFDAAPDRLFKEFVQQELDADVLEQYKQRSLESYSSLPLSVASVDWGTGGDRSAVTTFRVGDLGPILRDTRRLIITSPT